MMERAITWMLVTIVCLIALFLGWQAFGQEDPKHPEAQVNRMIKAHQRDHYIDFDRAVCFIRIDDDGSWILHCEYRGEGPILKKFECMCPPCRDCPKKWKLKYKKCKRALKKCLRPEKNAKIRSPQKKTKPIDDDNNDDGHSAGRRSPGRNGDD